MESGTLEGTLYGGVGTIPGNSTTRETMHPNQWQVRVMNTSAEHDFDILLGANKMHCADQVSVGGKRAGIPAMSANAEKITDQ
jgi:hypothetical protein